MSDRANSGCGDVWVPWPPRRREPVDRLQRSEEPQRSGPPADSDHVAKRLSVFVNTHIMARGRPILPDDGLESAGVDSVAFLKILLFIEAEFGFWIPDDDLVEENIASARALATYICRHGHSSP